MPSVFSKIISGEIPSYKVAEDNDHLAFLDINPLTAGHTLVVPKKEVDYIFSMDKDAYTALHLFAFKVAIGLKAAVPCKRIGTAVIGLEVPHVHIHLVPMNTVSDLNFAKEKLVLSAAELEELAVRIRAAI